MAEVHQLRDAQVGDATKQRFLDWLAGAYDKFVEAGGNPDSVVFVIGELRGAQACGWTMCGLAEGCADAVVARAIVGLQRQLNDYPQDG